jgi:hypothetical protein
MGLDAFVPNASSARRPTRGQDFARHEWINTVSTVLGTWRPVRLYKVRTWQKGMSDRISSRKRGQKKIERSCAERRSSYGMFILQSIFGDLRPQYLVSK